MKLKALTLSSAICLFLGTTENSVGMSCDMFFKSWTEDLQILCSLGNNPKLKVCTHMCKNQLPTEDSIQHCMDAGYSDKRFKSSVTTTCSTITANCKLKYNNCTTEQIQQIKTICQQAKAVCTKFTPHSL